MILVSPLFASSYNCLLLVFLLYSSHHFSAPLFSNDGFHFLTEKTDKKKIFQPWFPLDYSLLSWSFHQTSWRMCRTFCWALEHEFILGLLQSGFSPKYSEAPFVIKLTNALLNAKYLQKVFSRPPGYRPSLKHLDSPQGPSSPFVCGKFPCGAGRLSSYQRYKSLTEEETKSVLATSEFVFSYQISFVVP